MHNDAETTATAELAFGADLDALIAQDIEEVAIDADLARSPHGVICIARLGGNSTPPLRLVVLLREHLQAIGLERELVDALGRWKDLTHPHVVAPQHVGESPRLLWFATPLHPGRSLAERLEQSGKMDLSSSLRVVEQLSGALHSAHRRGFAHGDVRAEHVVMTRDGWAQLTHFGVGRVLRESGIGLPLPAWTPPIDLELATSSASQGVEAAADQLGLAALFESCLNGAQPIDEVLGWPESMPQPMRMVVRQAKSRRASSRYRTILEFVAALHSAGADPVRESPAERAQELLFIEPRARKTSNAVRVAGLCLVTALAIGGGFQVLNAFQRHDDHEVFEMVESKPPVATQEAALPPTVFDNGAASRESPPPELREPQSRPQARPVATSGTRTARPPARSPVTAATTAPAVITPPVLPPPDTVFPIVMSPPREVVVPPARGRISVSSRPWGALFIDGRPMGETPLADIELMPRTYRVRILRDGFLPYERIVEVQAGATVRLVDIVLTPRTR